MAIPLRVIQRYKLDEQDEMVCTGYKLQVKTAEGWANVPIVFVKEGEQEPD
jgi:hypothetical protein